MSEFTKFKNVIRFAYAKYYAYINPVLKFLLALIMFTMINKKMGYMAKIDNAAIVLMASLFCSFMPVTVTALLAGAFVLLHFYKLGLEIAIVAAVLLLLMYILYLRFAPKESLAVLLMPIFFTLKMPYVIPLAMGLLGTPLSIFSVGFGVVLSYLIDYGNKNEAILQEAASENMVTKLRTIVESMMANKSMICMIVAFSVALILVYFVRKIAFAHSWKIASVGGAITMINILFVCRFKFHLDYSVLGIMVGPIIGALLCLLVEFAVHSLDYKRTETLQFEDAEYYYYVKAVPKKDFVGRKRTAARPQQGQRSAAPESRTVRTANGVRRTT